MNNPRFCFILLLSWLFIFAVTASAQEAEGAGRRATNAAARSQAAAARAARAAQLARVAAIQRLTEAMGTVERRFSLPSGTLGPMFPYSTVNGETIAIQLQHSRVRMLAIATQPHEGYTLYGATGLWQDAQTGARRLTLILFRVYPDGRVVPLGHTQVQPGVPPGHSLGFMDRFVSEARDSWRSLGRQFGSLHIFGP